jgi:hypothetical protein
MMDLPWSGWIGTTGDALLILEAARRGFVPRVTRRLVADERRIIASGSVFVYDEQESGIKRWTDGMFWSPSRMLGNFLLYRELDSKGAEYGRRRKGSDEGEDEDERGEGGEGGESGSLSRPRGETRQDTLDHQRERMLVGSHTNNYKFKPDGLMKKVRVIISCVSPCLTVVFQTFTLTISGVTHHLISYYKVPISFFLVSLFLSCFNTDILPRYPTSNPAAFVRHPPFPSSPRSTSAPPSWTAATFGIRRRWR